MDLYMKLSTPVEKVKLCLPDDILKLILNKLLRLILDEIEDNRELLLKKRIGFLDNFFTKYIKEVPKYYQSSSNIDFIIKLLMAKNIGADPNTKNYKNNTILYLLVHECLATSYLGKEDLEYKILLDKINLLHKYGANIQINNFNGDTISHLLISTYVTRNCDGECELNIIEFLQNLGMSINNIQNDLGNTAYDIGMIFLQKPLYQYNQLTIFDKLNLIEDILKLKTLLLRERFLHR